MPDNMKQQDQKQNQNQGQTQQTQQGDKAKKSGQKGKSH